MADSFPRGKLHAPCAVIPSRVLVVDEEALVRWSLCAALAAEGFDAVAAAGSLEARRLAEEWPPPRVAIIDSRTSPGGHLSLIGQLRRLYPACRVIVMTTAARGQEPGAGPGPNGVSIVEKPFDLARVVRLVMDLSDAA